MYNYLKHLNLNVVVVCTKADKISKNQVINAVRNVRKILELKDDDKCYPVSSETKIGVEKVEEVIEQTDENAIKTATSAVYDFYQNATKKLSDEEKGKFIYH